MKLAVIIKHPGRDYDYRIDIVDVPQGTLYEDVRVIIEREMLGPFEVLAFTEKVNFDRKIDLNKYKNNTENHHK